MARYLLHDDLRVRFPALLLADAVILVAAWTLSYLLLPEGLLAGRTGAAVLAGDDLAGGSVVLEAARLLAINLVVVAGAIIAPNLIRQGGYPLGYSTLVVITAVFGVSIGTNSFAISLGGKLPPSLEVFGSSGLYEIAAYALAATSTISIVRWQVVAGRFAGLRHGGAVTTADPLRSHRDDPEHREGHHELTPPRGVVDRRHEPSAVRGR